MSAKVPVWSWTDAVAKANVPTLTKCVCWDIARYLSSAGKGWRITVEQIARDTGMSERAVRVHLARAKRAGLLDIIRHHDGRGHRTATEYRPRFPDNCVLSDQPAEISLPAPDAGRPYRHVVPVGRRAGQVPFQERKRVLSIDSQPNREGVRARDGVAPATVSPQSYWPEGDA